MKETIDKPESEFWDFVNGVESGTITLVCAHPAEPPQFVYAGNCIYNASNGWRIEVFNDCNGWDYFDTFYDENGKVIHFIAAPDNPRPLGGELDIMFAYSPSEEIAWQRYGIPGYLSYRCDKCSYRIQCYNVSGAPICIECGGTIPRESDDRREKIEHTNSFIKELIRQQEETAKAFGTPLRTLEIPFKRDEKS